MPVHLVNEVDALTHRDVATAAARRNARTRVLIVDDHKICREGLRLQLESEPGISVTGEAGNAPDGLCEALSHRPDVILMDIEMPGLSCFDVMRRVHEKLPDTKVIILSAHKSDEQIGLAIQSHAWGYAVKDEGFAEVRQAIRNVMAGRLYYAQDILDRIQTTDGGLQWGERAETRLGTLTRRERELLVLLGQGYSLKQSSLAMHVSYKTVDKHKVNLMKKLDIHNRVELARFAIREHLVHP